MVGRFIGAWVLRYVRTGIVLAFNAVAACALVLFSVMSSGHLAIGSILLVGLFNSIMFPSIFALGVAELGPLTGDGSGVLNMAIVGGAVVPLLAGALADKIGIQHAFVLPAVCYLYILYYALRGSRPRVIRAGMKLDPGSMQIRSRGMANGEFQRILGRDLCLASRNSSNAFGLVRMTRCLPRLNEKHAEKTDCTSCEPDPEPEHSA